MRSPASRANAFSEIFPEGVDAFMRMQRAQRIGPPLPSQPAKGFAYFRPKERVVDPTLRRVYIEFRRHDVVITGEHDRRATREQAARMFLQPFEPAQLVIEFRARRRIAVRQIEASYDQAVDLCF